MRSWRCAGSRIRARGGVGCVVGAGGSRAGWKWVVGADWLDVSLSGLSEWAWPGVERLGSSVGKRVGATRFGASVSGRGRSGVSCVVGRDESRLGMAGRIRDGLEAGGEGTLRRAITVTENRSRLLRPDATPKLSRSRCPTVHGCDRYELVLWAVTAETLSS